MFFGLSSVGISDLSFILFSCVVNARTIYDVRVTDVKTIQTRRCLSSATARLLYSFFGVAKTHNYTFQVNIRLKINVRFLGSTTIHSTTHSIYTFYYRYHDYYGHLNYDWLSQCCDGHCVCCINVLRSFCCGKFFGSYVLLHIVQFRCIKTTYSGRQHGTNNNNSNKYYFYREMTNNFVEKFAWTELSSHLCTTGKIWSGFRE